MYELAALQPLNAELDEELWPQMRLSDVAVYTMRNGVQALADVLDICMDGPFRVKGRLLKRYTKAA